MPCMKPYELDRLADRWAIAMRGEGMSPNTVRVYTASVKSLTSWQRASGKSGLDREAVRGFIAAILDGGGSRSTANLRSRALRGFAGWLAAEGLTRGNVLAGMKPPKPDEQIVPRLTDAELEKLTGACAAEPGMYGVRDEAMVRLMAETGARAEEVLRMNLDDLDLIQLVVFFRKTKGNKERMAPFSAATASAIRTYLRHREQHGIAAAGPLWLSQRGDRLSYAGMYKGLGRRAAAAGIAGFHPHRLRHTAAARWLAAGGSEGGLMAITGWSNRRMIDRYTADVRADLALAEARNVLAS